MLKCWNVGIRRIHGQSEHKYSVCCFVLALAGVNVTRKLVIPQLDFLNMYTCWFILNTWVTYPRLSVYFSLMYINGVLSIELIKGQLTDNNEYNGAYTILKDKDTIPYAPSVKVFCDSRWHPLLKCCIKIFRSGHSFFSSPPQRTMTSDFEGFSFKDCIHYIYFPILILGKEPVFPYFNVRLKPALYH